MKFIVVLMCIGYSMGFPSSPQEISENVQKTIAGIQEQSQKAVADLNSRLLSVTGAKSNEELLNTVQSQSQAYLAQIKGVADSINTQIQAQRDQIDSTIGNLAKQLSDSAARFLGNNDPTKTDQVRNSFNSILEQANNIQRTVQAQGTSVQAVFNENLSKIFESTLQTAKSLAQQLDNAAPKTN